MTGLVLHALWVSILLGLAAALAEPLARALRLPTRAVWGAALLGSVALVGWGFSSPAQVTEASIPPVALSEDAAAPDMPAPGHRAGGWWDRLLPLPGLVLAAAHDRIPAPPAPFREQGEHLFGLAWAVWSVLLLGLLSGGALHHRRTRRRWPREEVLGHLVRIVPGGGPAVAGFLRPEILLPRWALELSEADLRLLLRHEEEHRRARDPLLLGGASLLVALAPWNPVLWWQLRRLRDALEVDCDARVLGRTWRTWRTGRTRQKPGSPRAPLPARPYAELLLRIGSLTPAGPQTRIRTPAPFVTPAIGGSRTQLERRIRAMRPERPHSIFLAGAAGAVVLLATAACLADRPTPVEPLEEAATAESGSFRAVEEFTTSSGPGSVTVEGSTPAAGESDPRNGGRVPLLQGQIEEPAADDDTWDFMAISGGSGESIAVVRSSSDLSASDPSPLIIVDGVILGAKSLDESSIPAGDIVSVEVTKGAAARELYGPRAAGGVISISTRAGEERRARNPPPNPPAFPPGSP